MSWRSRGSTAYPEPVTYPFDLPPGLDLAEEYADARAASGLLRVRLPYGDDAWLATRYADARLVLGDPRFSRAAAAEHDPPGRRRWS